MRRVLAVVAAAAMVVGSLALRSRLDHASADRAQVLRLTCATEVEAACRQMQERDRRIRLTVEPAGTTEARLATLDGAPGLDGWLVAGPWADIVELERRSHALPPVFDASRAVVARSPLVLAVWKDRAAALAPRCPGGPGWKCLGEAAGTPGGWKALGGKPEWGPVKLGIAPPASDGIGALVLGQATGAWFGRTDLSAADLDDEGFQRWLAALARATQPSPTSAVDTMLVTGPATFDAAGTTEAAAGPPVARSARRSTLDLLYPAPMATADLVLATPMGGGASAALRRVLDGDLGAGALAAAGWRVGGRSPVEGVPASPLPPGAGLPSPGVIQALRTRWHDAGGP